MPPTPKRDCCLFLFDLDSSNKEELLEGVLKILTHKWFSASSNMYRLLLVNAKKTRNEKNRPHVYDPKLIDFEPRAVRQSIEEAETEKNGCNWLDAISLGIYYVEKAQQLKNVVTMQLVLFSDLGGPLSTVDQRKSEQIVRELKDVGCFLYIIGPNVKLPFTINNPEQVHECMKQIVVDKSNNSLCTAKEIVQNVQNSVLCDVKVGMNLIYSFKNLFGSQPFRQPLDFGTNFPLPVHTVRVYRPEKDFRIKSKDPNRMSSVLAEDESVSVFPENTAKGVVRHNKFVLIPDKDMFKLDTQRSLVVLGCTKEENVPSMYFYGEETYMMLPDDSAVQCPSRYEILHYLIKILAEEKKYMIVRRVYSRGTNPNYWVLIPQPDHKPPCFVMTPLPYADQVLHVLKAKKPEPERTEQADDEFEKFYKSIDVTRKACVLDVPLGPRMMLGRYSTKLIQILAEKTLGKSLSCDIEIPKGNNKFLDDLLKIHPVLKADDECLSPAPDFTSDFMDPFL